MTKYVKKDPPLWLVGTKKIMTYLLGTTVMVMVLDRLFPNPADSKFALEICLGTLGLLQFILDNFYKITPWSKQNKKSE